ncbi:hypothetical protein M0R36_01180 [bacterium]|jgi:hypothetical protein|nr:hypothetical protein [bacterium]
MYLRNNGYFIPRTEKENKLCRVCNAVCIVRRNVYGPVSFISAVAKKKSG